MQYVVRPEISLANFSLFASCATAALALSAPASAQDTNANLHDPVQSSASSLPESIPALSPQSTHKPMQFEADRVEYLDDAEIATASGNVFLHRDDQSVRADQVSWNRASGKIIAHGNVRMVDQDGNQLFTESVELTDDFKMGAMSSLLLTLREGGRLAAAGGTQQADGKILLGHAAYTGCAVVDAKDCDKKPSWQIIAKQVIYDPKRKLVRFNGARMVMFGQSLIPLPSLFIATDGRAISGLLIPNLRISASNGLEVSETYYKRLADNRDIALTAYVFSQAAPMISGQFRALTDKGAYQVTGYATRSARIPVAGTNTNQQTNVRGYLEANGAFQFSPNWSGSFSGRITADRTFLRRYFISNDDILRSTADISRVDASSHFSITGWAFQTLRSNEKQGLVPIALPVIDYRRRLANPVLGGKLEFQLNSLAITRTSGQDTQRAFAKAQWDMRRITPMGQVFTLTTLLRGDAYHSADNALTTNALYRGNPGWQTRGVAVAAVDVTWPFISPLWKGTQVLTPHFQIVASPSTRNLAVPNEDARAIELEDGNLFALNRFSGYDRIEDGVRFAYGVDWQLERPNWRLNATVGQSYRLTNQPTLLPNGTGLSDKTSDIVGRLDVRYKNFLKLTHRFRLDKDTLAFRRNEIDATLGSERTYLEVGYARLNRQIAASVEDLRDSHELRAAGRVAFARNWSAFGSGVFDLSQQNLLGAATIKELQPLRTRFGVAYQNDCLELGFTWRRDYVSIGDAGKGNSFQLHFVLRNLGFK
ncbi:MAG: hypothetical protein RLY97_2137 [Pseudomonadota bacterium]